MKNGTLRFIPLQSDLCLNKQKVDISDFKGWQKCNAPVYGDCLSPLYKKDDTHHDIFLGSDTYDFSAGKLYKNGTEVLSGAGSKGIVKTKLANQNISSIDIRDSYSNSVNLIETSASSFTVHLKTMDRNYTIEDCSRIVKTKCFNKSADIYGAVVLYLHTSGKYGYFVVWVYDDTVYSAYGESGTTLFDNWEVTAPLIQTATKGDNTVIVSLFNNCGANIERTEVKNFLIRQTAVYDNVTFNGNISTTRYETIINPCAMTVNVVNREKHGYSSVSRQFTYEMQQELYFQWSGNFDINSIIINSPDGTANGESETLVVNSTENTRKWARIRITYYQDTASSDWYNYSHKIERYGASDWGTVDEGSGIYSSDTIFNKIAKFYKRNSEEMPVTIKYTYMSNNSPDDPTVAGTSVLTTAEALAEGEESAEGAIYVSPALNHYEIVSNCQAIYNLDKWPENEDKTLANSKYTFFSGNYTQFVGNNQITYPNFYPSFILGNQYNLADGTSQNMYNWSTSYRFEFNQYTKSPFENLALKECDCVLDDGRFYCVSPLSANTTDPLPMKMLALAGNYSSFNTTTKKISYTPLATFDISYQVSDNIYPKYFDGMSISLQDKYLRILYKFKANPTDEKDIMFLVDSTKVSGTGGKNVFLYPGVIDGTDHNLQGACLNTGYDNWRILFNNNMVSNIACYEDVEYIGTIISDWFSVDPDFSITYASNELIYKDNTGTIWRVRKLNQGSSGLEWEYKVVENRYIVLNTINYFNCYDTVTGLKRHWASDYNNRIMYGYGFVQYAVSDAFSKLLTSELFRGLLITGQNANYEMTKDTITGIELGAISYERCLKDFVTFPSCLVPYGATEGIDLYRGDDDSTSAKYICSYQNSLKYIDTDLTNPDAVYPIADGGDVRYNPNLFTQFITSYNNKDMVISDGVAYKLVYYNNVTPIMAYYLLDGVESLENAFVLQSTFYGVSKTRLYQMNYSYGVGVEVVCDITNMEYLGALPTQALFWSAQNRAIYSFKGSCIMQLTQYANDLTGIYGKWYNPATQELFLDTNIGILVFSDLGTYCLEWDNETNTKSVRDIFFFEDYFIINLIADVTESHYYSYNNKTGYESNKVYFITKYYGNGLVPITVNNIYIRLYDQAVENAEGFIKMKGYTITDKGTETDTKEVLIGGEDNPEATPPTVAGEAWDSETGTMLVKYTPQYNRGLGFALEVETTFPIIDIKFDYVENGTIESQIAHVNI